ncbi:hypothetical protein KIN20_026874 [Parelaphostrongylus tenuis]|uniref:Uncharacterized protein n=1 Tax=Parelaphostrongylus tenuis TaxID=148309 RepID=A0AAD5WD90_PARTN|nr:hypothetical protein KIN20_026874 [Parelaphostrongylus tenuis]
MDNASAYGAEDCRFESCRGRNLLFMLGLLFEAIIMRNMGYFGGWRSSIVIGKIARQNLHSS